MIKEESKELLVTLTPSQMIYLSVMKEYLKERGNRKFLLEVMKLAEDSLEKEKYLAEAQLGKFVLGLKINPRAKRHFKAFLTKEEYSRFWYLGERLGLETKRQILLGLCFLAEKVIHSNIEHALNQVITIFIKDQNKVKLIGK